MRVPSVVVIASPYEGELLGRSLSDTGLRVLRADDGEGALALLATELPIVIILGTTLTAADPAAIVAEARARHPQVALFLLADPGDPAVAELRPRVTEVLQKPTDFDALAASIERVAVDAERAELEDYEIVEIAAAVPQPVAHVPTLPMPDALPMVPAHRTEVLSEGGGSLAAPFPRVSARKNGDTNGNLLLRADDGLGELDAPELRVDPHEVTRPRFEARSTIVRTLDRELSQAERRLFPDQAGTSQALGALDYDDALSDIDLDALAIDTIPGLHGALGQERTTHSGALLPSTAPIQPPAPLRPVQEEGSLEADDVAELIARLHEHAFTGALVVRRDESEKAIYFDQGEPIGARSTQRHDQLAELLYREGKLTREQATRARAADDSVASREGAARVLALRLVTDGLLKDGEVFATLRRYIEEIFFSLIGAESGRYELGPTAPAAEDRVRLPPVWALLFEGVRRKYGPERLLTRLGNRELVLHPTTLFARVVEVAGLSAEERRTAALFDGERSLAEVRAALGGRVPESAVAQLAFSLRATGALDTGGAAAPADLRSQSTVVTDLGERRARPRVSEPAQLAAEDAVDRERIAAKRAQVMDADYFTVLGLSREASTRELERAHARQRADFDLARFSPAVAAEHAEVLAEIVAVIDEAYQVLRHAGVRARYTEHLLAPDEDPQGS